MNQILSFLFIIFWISCVLSWFFAIIEMICAYSFVNFFFKIGIPIIKRVDNIPISSNIIQPDNIYSCEEGKFKFITNNECLFIPKFKLFNFFRIRTPFPIRGRVKWDIPYADSYARIRGQIPLSSTIFFGSFLLGWTVGGISNADFKIILISWLFAILIVGLSFFVEIGRFGTMINELRELVSKEQGNIRQQKQ